MVLGADGGIAADVADDAAADLPRPCLGSRGRRVQDGEGEAQLEEELPQTRRHGWDLGEDWRSRASAAASQLQMLLSERWVRASSYSRTR